MKTPRGFARDVAKTKSVLLVLVIVLSGLAVGALAGYRMHLTADMEAGAGDVNATVLIVWPDAQQEPFEANLTVDGKNATALGFLEKAAEVGNFTFTVDEGSIGTYVTAIDGHHAKDNCGWLFAVGHDDNEPQDGDRAADLMRVFDGGSVHWRWDCI